MKTPRAPGGSPVVPAIFFALAFSGCKACEDDTPDVPCDAATPLHVADCGMPDVPDAIVSVDRYSAEDVDLDVDVSIDAGMDAREGSLPDHPTHELPSIGEVGMPEDRVASDGDVDGAGLDAPADVRGDARDLDARDAVVDVDAARGDVRSDVAADNACVDPANQALQFSGAQYVTVADAASLHLGDMTVEAWVQLSSTLGGANGFYTVVAKPYGTGFFDSFALWFSGGWLYGGVNLVSFSDGAYYHWDGEPGHWHHLAFTYNHVDGHEVLYVDGTVVATATASGVPAYDATPLRIGDDINYGGSDGWLYGKIDEVRIWSVVRSAAEIQQDLSECTAGAAAGLAGYWPLNDGAGQTATDVSGNGNHGQLGATAGVDVNDPAWAASDAPF